MVTGMIPISRVSEEETRRVMQRLGDVIEVPTVFSIATHARSIRDTISLIQYGDSEESVERARVMINDARTRLAIDEHMASIRQFIKPKKSPLQIIKDKFKLNISQVNNPKKLKECLNEICLDKN